jgi:hypothetical protein
LSVNIKFVNDKVYQLLAHGRWLSPGTPASSTTKTGHRDIAEIMLKVALNTPLVSSNSSYIFNVLLIKKYLYKKKSAKSKTLYL